MMGVPKHPSNSCPSVIPLHLAHCRGPDTEKALTADQKLKHGGMVSPTLIDKPVSSATSYTAAFLRNPKTCEYLCVRAGRVCCLPGNARACPDLSKLSGS